MAINVPVEQVPPGNAMRAGPPDLAVQASGGSGGDGSPPVDVPTTAGVTASLDPKAAAGVSLAKFVLWIATASIGLLLAYLLVMDLVVAWNVGSAYNQVLNTTRTGSELYTLDRIKRFEDGLTDLLKNPTKVMSSDDLQNATVIVEMLDQLPSLTSAQKAQLEHCSSPPPTTIQPSRNGELSGCLEILTGTEQAALQAAASTASVQAAGESANKINEQRQAFHTFWIQAAQLILLNLLLPLLTALFGYIFGTQQAHTNAG